MPIRAELRHFYRGAAWRAVRERILARAGNCCERCGAPNHKTVLRQYGWWTPASLAATVWAQNGRFTDDGSVARSLGADVEFLPGDRQLIKLPWSVANPNGGRVERLAHTPNTGQHRWVYIVLTIAHLNHVAGDDRDQNLQAMCQWCHLAYDVRFHKATRSSRKDAARPLLTEVARG